MEKTLYREDEIEGALKDFVKRYERQGYYSSNNGRIHLEDIADYCKIVAV
jgi:ribosomal protein S21